MPLRHELSILQEMLAERLNMHWNDAIEWARHHRAIVNLPEVPSAADPEPQQVEVIDLSSSEESEKEVGVGDKPERVIDLCSSEDDEVGSTALGFSFPKGTDTGLPTLQSIIDDAMVSEKELGVGEETQGPVDYSQGALHPADSGDDEREPDEPGGCDEFEAKEAEGHGKNETAENTGGGDSLLSNEATNSGEDQPSQSEGLLVVHQFPGQRAMNILRGDRDSVSEGRFLTGSMIMFSFRHWLSTSPRLRQRTHLVDPLLFQKLKNLQGVGGSNETVIRDLISKDTKGKRFLIFPIHSKPNHWRGVVAVMPGYALPFTSEGCIVGFDSLGELHGKTNPDILLLAKWLLGAFKMGNGDGSLVYKFSGSPKQPNGFDCGPYMLQAVQTFLENRKAFFGHWMGGLDHNLWDLKLFQDKRQSIRAILEQVLKDSTSTTGEQVPGRKHRNEIGSSNSGNQGLEHTDQIRFSNVLKGQGPTSNKKRKSRTRYSSSKNRSDVEITLPDKEDTSSSCESPEKPPRKRPRQASPRKRVELERITMADIGGDQTNWRKYLKSLIWDVNWSGPT